MLRTRSRERFKTHTRDSSSASVSASVSGRRLIAVAALAVAALLAFTACGSTTASSIGSNNGGPGLPGGKPTAQQILADAQKANVKDITFTMAVETKSSEGANIKMTGQGKATMNPKRMAMTLNLGEEGMEDAAVMEAVVDEATNTFYSRFVKPDILAKGWSKTSNQDASDALPGIQTQVTPPYSKLTNVTLTGEDTVNGVKVWHVKGTYPTQGETPSSDMDIYVHQSDNLPAKMVIHTTGDSSGSVTIVYTGVNTGVTVDIPKV
jgi:hypothetical protein